MRRSDSLTPFESEVRLEPEPGPPPVPRLLPGRPPLAILVDFDGTIATTDVGDEILYRFVGESYRADDDAWVAGVMGSRTVLTRQAERLPGDPTELIRTAEAQPHDPTFAAFARRALDLGMPVEVVSDGIGFYIEAALKHLGVPPIPVICARTTFDGERARMTFPNGHPDCFVCGTCKRQRVMAHRAAGRTVVFVGDGNSDRYAAAYADVIFAKRNLVDLCRTEGWQYTPWHRFSEIESWLDEAVVTWQSDPASLPRGKPRPYVCGPELWGPGRTDPPPAR